MFPRILKFLLGFRKLVFPVLQFILRILDLPLPFSSDFIDALQRSPVQSELHFIGQVVHLVIVAVRVAGFRRIGSNRQVSFRVDAAEYVRIGHDNEGIQAAFPDVRGAAHHRFDVHRRVYETDDRVFLLFQGNAVFHFLLGESFFGLMAEADCIPDLIRIHQILFRIQSDFSACLR